MKTTAAAFSLMSLHCLHLRLYRQEMTRPDLAAYSKTLVSGMLNLAPHVEMVRRQDYLLCSQESALELSYSTEFSWSMHSRCKMDRSF